MPKVFDRGIRVSFGMPSGFAPYIFHIRLNQDRNLHYNLFLIFYNNIQKNNIFANNLKKHQIHKLIIQV